MNDEFVNLCFNLNFNFKFQFLIKDKTIILFSTESDHNKLDEFLKLKIINWLLPTFSTKEQR